MTMPLLDDTGPYGWCHLNGYIYSRRSKNKTNGCTIWIASDGIFKVSGKSLNYYLAIDKKPGAPVL